MAIWRCLSVLLILTSAHAAANADDLAKLKASLAERFSQYRSASVAYTVSWPSMDDPSKTFYNHCVWRTSHGCERITAKYTMGDDVREADIVCDGDRTAVMWTSDLTKAGKDVTGSAHIYNGAISSEDMVPNLASTLFGCHCQMTGSDLLDMLNHSDVVALPSIELDGATCSAWGVSGQGRDKGIIQGRLAVNVNQDWLPVLWESKLIVDEKVQVDTSIRITSALRIRIGSHGEQVYVPRQGQQVTTMRGVVEKHVMTLSVEDMKLGESIPKESFRISVPDGFDVLDQTDGAKAARRYVSGGAASERQRLKTIAEQSMAESNASRAVSVDAGPSRATNWTMKVLIIAVVLVLSSLLVWRVRGQAD